MLTYLWAPKRENKAENLGWARTENALCIMLGHLDFHSVFPDSFIEHLLEYSAPQCGQVIGWAEWHITPLIITGKHITSRLWMKNLIEK